MSAETEYIRGKIQERNGALTQRPAARFTPRGNDVWASRSGRTYSGGSEPYSNPVGDYSSPVSGNGMGNLQRLVGGRRKKRGGAFGSTGKTQTKQAPPSMKHEQYKYTPEQLANIKQLQADNIAAANTRQAEKDAREAESHRLVREARRMEMIRNPKDFAGKAINALVHGVDIGADWAGTVPGLGQLVSFAHKNISGKLVPNSKYYTGESVGTVLKNAAFKGAIDYAKDKALGAVKGALGMGHARRVRRAMGAASPDLATLQLLNQGENQYEGLVGGRRRRQPAAASDKRRERGAMISRIMKEHGVTLGQASRMLKEGQ